MLTKIDHGKARILSHIPLNDEQITKAKVLLDAGAILHQAMEDLDAVMPPNSYHQFFGKWDLLKIDMVKERSGDD